MSIRNESEEMEVDEESDEVPLNESENSQIHSQIKDKEFLRRRHFLDFIVDKLKLWLTRCKMLKSKWSRFKEFCCRRPGLVLLILPCILILTLYLISGNEIVNLQYLSFKSHNDTGKKSYFYKIWVMTSLVSHLRLGSYSKLDKKKWFHPG